MFLPGNWGGPAPRLVYASAYVSVAVSNVSLARQTLERCISDMTSWLVRIT